MTVRDDPVLAEIDTLRSLQSTITDRIAFLRRLRSRPAVVPVLVYYRYGKRYEEPASLWYSDGDPLEGAYRELEFMSIEGYGSGVGVSINGILVDMKDLRGLFGDLD